MAKFYEAAQVEPQNVVMLVLKVEREGWLS
jgi:hypothetical protein